MRVMPGVAEAPVVLVALEVPLPSAAAEAPGAAVAATRGAATVLLAAASASARPPISTWTTATGLAAPVAAAVRNAAARTSPSPFSAWPFSPTHGIAVTITASQLRSASASASASRKSCGVAAVVRSRGGRGRSPSARQASYVRRPRDSELPRIATRGPAGSGWSARSRPASTISVTVSTRITPACRMSAETVASGIRLIGTA